MPDSDTASQHVLIIRFSSLGDIFFGLGAATALKNQNPQAKIDWLTRQDFADVLQCVGDVDEVISFSRHQGVWGLMALGFQLRKKNYTHVYDAHNNLRSRIISWIVAPAWERKWKVKFARRPKNRWKRYLLFRWGKNLFPKPFRGNLSFIDPLKKWGVQRAHFKKSRPQVNEPTIGPILRELHFNLPRTIALAPSATWELKRWPKEHWKQLIHLCPDVPFVVLGGPDDRFCEELAKEAPDRVQNLAGVLNWSQSLWVLKHAKGLVSNDTGPLHMADYIGKPSVALIGPTAFGYPSRPSSKVMELSNLWCKPCSKDGRGQCKNKSYKKCLYSLPPASVAKRVQEW